MRLTLSLPLLLTAGLCAGCNSSTSPDQFHTYNELLTEEHAKSNPDNSPGESAETTPPVANVDEEDRNAPADAPPLMASATTPATNPGRELPSAIVPQDSFGDETAEIPASALAPLNIVNGESPSEILKVVDGTPRREPQGSAMAGVNPVTGAPIPVVTALPGGIQLLVPKKDFRAEGPQAALRVSYDDLDLLKVLNMEPVPDDAPRHFPAWLAELNGKPVRIRGFMYPTFESSGIEQFVLARDNQICCFGRDPKVYDLIAVTLKPNSTTNYIPNRPFDVVGKFRIDMLAEGGKPLGLYWLEDAQVVDR